MALMFLNGEGMAGGSAHPHIAGSQFLGPRRTAADYRFYSFRDEFPGLAPVERGNGQQILGELYEVPMDRLRNLLFSEPAELELSMITLDDGTLSFGMVVRAELDLDAPGVQDITVVASWRGHREPSGS